jgi:hypothetical protein
MKIVRTTLVAILLLPIVCHGQQIDPADQKAMEALQRKKEAIAKEKAQIDKDIAKLEAKIEHKPPPPETPRKDPLQEFATEYKLRIAQSLTDKNKVALPALFQYVHPVNGGDSAQVDVALSIGHDFASFPTPLGTGSWGLTSEYHYNNAPAKLQDSLILGGKLDFALGSSTKNGQWVRTAVSYKHDNLVSGDGVVADLLWFVSIPQWHIGDFYWKWGNVLAGRVEPFVGLQDEFGNGASKAFKDGNRFSARAGIALQVEMFPDYLANRLALSVSEGYWGHMQRSGGFDLYATNQSYFEVALTYWLNTGSDPSGKLQDKDKHFGFTAKYTYGDNPSTSQFDANTWTFGLSVLF